MVVELPVEGISSTPLGTEWLTNDLARYTCEDVIIEELAIERESRRTHQLKRSQREQYGVFVSRVRLKVRPSFDRRVTVQFAILRDGIESLGWSINWIKAEEGKVAIGYGESERVGPDELMSLLDGEPVPVLRVTVHVISDR